MLFGLIRVNSVHFGNSIRCSIRIIPSKNFNVFAKYLEALADPPDWKYYFGRVPPDRYTSHPLMIALLTAPRGENIQ